MYEIGMISPLYPCIENGATFTDLMPKLGFYGDKHFLLYSNFNLATAYYEADEMLLSGRYTFRHLSKPTQFTHFVNGVHESVARIRQFLDRLDKLDVWTMPQAELIDLLIENSEIEANIFAYYNNTQPQNFAIFEQKIMAALRKKGLAEDEAIAAMSTLTTSEVPTRLSEDESDWLRLVLAAKQQLPSDWKAIRLEKTHPGIYSKLQKHFDVYKTLLLGDGNWQPDVSHYVSLLRNDIVRPAVELNERLKELTQFATKTKVAKAALIKRLALTDDIVFYAHVISEVGHVRLMMRIDGFMPLAYANDKPIVEALARTYKLGSPEFRYITYDELLSLRSKNPQLNAAELKRRFKEKHFLLIVNNGKYEMLFGKSADMAFAKLVPEANYYTVEELSGSTAMGGRVKGMAVVFNWGDNLQDALDKLPKDAILVAGQTRPQLMPLIRASKGIITDEGGVMSHAAIVARELEMPCIVGTKVATKVLRTGDLIELDADNGVIKVIEHTNKTKAALSYKRMSATQKTKKLAGKPASTTLVVQPILQFDEIKQGETGLVGGKGGSLAALSRAGLPVPPGFVVTTECFRAFSTSKIPGDVQKKILAAFDKLGIDYVAVRSSAIAEDSKDTSWAGQFDTLLNVTRDGLIAAIQSCWYSAESDLVQDYAKDNKIGREDLALAVVVQAMVSSDVSGVAFTHNPVTGAANEIMIEACFGLGEMLVQGMVTPDNFLVDKQDLSVMSHAANKQQVMLSYVKGQNIELPVPNPKASKLTKTQLLVVAGLAKRIEDFYGTPQDIEWAMSKGRVYIVQSRPITTLKSSRRKASKT